MLAQAGLLLLLARPAGDGRGRLSSMVGGHRPGDRVAIAYLQRGQAKTATVALPQDPTREVVTCEKAGMPVTDAIRAFREAWLASRVRDNTSGKGAR